jgi:hypothetical protein
MIKLENSYARVNIEVFFLNFFKILKIDQFMVKKSFINQTRKGQTPLKSDFSKELQKRVITFS